MFGLSSANKEKIADIIEGMFDSLALQLLGDLPRFKNKKTLVIGTKKSLNLVHLFIQAMRNKPLNKLELDIAKGLLNTSGDYIDALKAKTKSNVVEAIDASIKNNENSPAQLKNIISEQMGKAQSHMITIADSEATKLKNVGTMLSISRVASGIGDSTPTIFFVCVHDDSLCLSCRKMHLMPDGITPRLWKFEELSHGYYKRGDLVPSVAGLHPSERCVLTYLPKGFGFINGKLSYKSQDHNELEKQRS